MRISTLLVLLVLSGILLSLPLTAQNGIRLTVSVTTADGAPARDLKKSDFSLQETGKAQAITSFVSPETSFVAPQLAANEYCNAPIASQSGAIFVVLDTIHTRFVEERNLRELILRFLGRAAQANRDVALVILNPKGLRVYHDYRTSSNVLLAALIKTGLGGMKGGTPPAGVDQAEVGAEAARLTAFSKAELSNAIAPDKPLLANVDLPLMMFQNVGHAVYGLPGRKSLVWVTNNIPFDIDAKSFEFASPKEPNYGAPVNGAQSTGVQDVLPSDQVKRLMPVWRSSLRDLLEGGAAVYPVAGQNSAFAIQTSLPSERAHLSETGGRPGVSFSGSDFFTQVRMQTLAQMTGGKAFYGSNDPFPEILQISNGNVAGYVLGFTTEANASPVFHRLEVAANKPGAVVSAPQGYFPSEGSLKSRAQDDVSLALQSPLAFTGLVFKLKFTGNEDSAGKKKVNMVISLAGDSGVLNEATRSVDLTLIAVAKDGNDKIVGKLNENAGGQFPSEAVATIKELGFQLKRSIELPAGDFALHFVIRDNQSGRMGSLILPLSVK
ncbi:MAG: VWA domain-containing protein [Acidobacteriota bacterium]|nr:VWA domain-containing protein [Acidobacteriota bacterium]